MKKLFNWILTISQWTWSENLRIKKNQICSSDYCYWSYCLTSWCEHLTWTMMSSFVVRISTQVFLPVSLSGHVSGRCGRKRQLLQGVLFLAGAQSDASVLLPHQEKKKKSILRFNRINFSEVNFILKCVKINIHIHPQKPKQFMARVTFVSYNSKLPAT